MGGKISARNAWNENWERERNENWVVKFLLEMKWKMREREREMKIGGKIPASLD